MFLQSLEGQELVRDVIEGSVNLIGAFFSRAELRNGIYFNPMVFIVCRVENAHGHIPDRFAGPGGYHRGVCIGGEICTVLPY